MERETSRLQDIFRSTPFQSLSTNHEMQGPRPERDARLTATTDAEDAVNGKRRLEACLLNQPRVSSSYKPYPLEN